MFIKWIHADRTVMPTVQSDNIFAKICYSHFAGALPWGSVHDFALSRESCCLEQHMF